MKKGFTLVELIGIIIILSLIALFTFPSIMKSLKNSDELKYNSFLDTLSLAAETYYQSKENVCNFNISNTCSIQLSDLVNEKLVDRELINPSTNEQISLSDTIILTKKADGTIEYNLSS